MLKDLQQNRGYWGKQISHLTKGIVDLLLPPTCAGCGRVGELICAECLDRVSWLVEPICQQCGRPQARPMDRCHDCQQEQTYRVHIRAATLYDEPVRSIIHKMKFEGLFGLAEPLANLMVAAWPKWESPIDLVVPIPLHPDRRRDRGYNQSELLVRAAQHHIVWLSDASALKRRRNTRPQIGLSAAERRANVNGAFWADPSKVTGHRILLVDDVCTTGSTLVSAAEALLEAGASSVAAYCLAIAVTN